MPKLSSLANEEFGYLTTTGRVSGQPREIEIWFGVDGGILYMLSGGRDRSNWVRNIMRQPRVSIRIGGQTFNGRARIVDEDSEEDRRARKLLVEKYQPGYSGDLTNWGRTALPVAVELEVEQG